MFLIRLSGKDCFDLWLAAHTCHFTKIVVLNGNTPSLIEGYTNKKDAAYDLIESP
jgi:hypothetical protein